ncbi:MAG: aspartate kinase [Bacillota bacterium]|jgi:aspartate kinase|nr:aspartate kinase [Candidatus Fermentithermobacillaceae bacterium]
MIVVQKFGGTCLDSQEKRQAACERIKDALSAGYKVCAVVSAMGRKGEPYATDTLISLARGVSRDVAPRELDLLVSCGEVISAVLMVQELRKRGITAMALSGGQAGIITDMCFGNANILTVNPGHVRRHLDERKVVVVAGFQGRADSGDITTLGRGGSDTTAMALGAALDAAYVEIYTDVQGIMTADPHVVASAKTIPLVSYEEVSQLAWEGAKVIHPRAVEIAQRAQVPVWIRSLQKDSRKTLLSGGEKHDNPWRTWESGKPVTGITYRDGLSQVIVKNPTGGDLESHESVFAVLRDKALDLINVFPDRLSFVIPREDVPETRRRLEGLDLAVDVRDGQSKVTVVGYGMHGRPGVMDTVVGTLSRKKIRVYASSDSNITISCLIDQESLMEAVNALHEAFHLASQS